MLELNLGSHEVKIKCHKDEKFVIKLKLGLGWDQDQLVLEVGGFSLA